MAELSQTEKLVQEYEDYRIAQQMLARIGLDDFLLGRFYTSLGDQEGALSALRDALRIDPGHYWSLYLMGSTLRKLNRSEEAVTVYTACISLRPDQTDALRERAVDLLILGRIREARADQATALEAFTEALQATEIADLYRGRGDLLITDHPQSGWY